MDSEKVIVAMSGGVDSSVAALLIKDAGYQVIGVTMKLYSDDEPGTARYGRGCCTVDDVEDARRVCHRLGVPHYVFNLQREFRAFVIDYFLQEYRRGRTPHPCIACNDRIKFDFLMKRADFLGASYVATGHYARIEHTGGRPRLLRAVDRDKDQSYVLYGMGPDELAHTLMPIGWYGKDEVRRMAIDAGFLNAEKPDSQDICFIPTGDYRAFLRERVTPTPGDIVDAEGNVLGRHQGIEFYTVGQRRGLGLESSVPIYVVGIDAERGRVIVGAEEDLYGRLLRATDVRYVAGREPEGAMDVTVKIRYKSAEAEATLHPHGDCAVIEFDQPQKAIAPGQAAVFYLGDEVLGGGRIDGQEPPSGSKKARPEGGRLGEASPGLVSAAP